MKFTVSKQVQAGSSELQDYADFSKNDSGLILVLADGAGGLSGGAKAAEFAVESVKKRVTGPVDSEQLCTFLTAIDREMSASRNFGETTCVVVILSEKGIAGASIGDSGALVLSQSGVDDLTRNQIRKPFLGSGRADPTGFRRSCLDGTLVVASDGLLKYTSQEKIAETAAGSDLDQAANKLIDLVRYKSGALPDDVSILLVREI